ncbi:perlucin-like [Pomacea canaliculata]|nr:perlucin-like [Pomacea canaliculata]
MLSLLVSTILLVAVAGQEIIRCPGGFQLSGNSCYKVIRDNATYPEAQVACRLIDSYLVSVESASEMESLASFLNKVAGDITEFPADYFWTSGNDLQIEGQWTWRQQKQTNIVVANWKNGKAPVSTSKISDKNCIAVQQSASYQWVNHKCSKIFPYVCETSALPVEIQPVYS